MLGDWAIHKQKTPLNMLSGVFCCLQSLWERDYTPNWAR
ncbi:hypothetical protein ACVK1X_005376 [Pseudomonas sp. PvR086]|jgi:hypothetical protein|nr:hypothetical protein [Pseudomonas frederiksbergensis]PZW66523.1 hypothetical protein F475_00430 [Pseudomonas sp. URMO17WK12:I6]